MTGRPASVNSIEKPDRSQVVANDPPHPCTSTTGVESGVESSVESIRAAYAVRSAR
jgi:hypothetical protein